MKQFDRISYQSILLQWTQIHNNIKQEYGKYHIYQGYRGLPAEFQNGYTQFDVVYCPYNINYYHPDNIMFLNTV